MLYEVIDTYLSVLQIICLKIIVNWLRGMRSCDRTRVKPVVEMLDKAIKTNGDITEGGCLRNE